MISMYKDFSFQVLDNIEMKMTIKMEMRIYEVDKLWIFMSLLHSLLVCLYITSSFNVNNNTAYNTCEIVYNLFIFLSWY